MLEQLDAVAKRLAAGEVTSRALVEACLAAAKVGEGPRVYLHLAEARALAAADAIDRARKTGQVPSRLAGIPISVKDLFDIEGEVTTSGSRVLAGAALAKKTTLAIQRLIDAGLVVIGRTNMTEFAFSGLGLNPHYGTPKNPIDRASARIPGGSSSGAAISVTDGMAFAGIGTDTGGSCRIPAALCGLAGWKPTAKRVSRDGAFPLSKTLDTIGPIAPSVACCAALDAVMSGERESYKPRDNLSGVRLAVPRALVFDDIEDKVAKDFDAAFRKLEAAGAKIQDIPMQILARIPEVNAKGGIAGYEAFQQHKDLIEKRGAEYDPRVLVRIVRGGTQTAEEIAEIRAKRIMFMSVCTADMHGFDALLMPTVPAIAPPIESLADDAEYARVNFKMLRNPSLINFLDGCAISLPMHEAGTAPTGLMLAAPHDGDRALLALSGAIEPVVGPKA